MEKIKYIFAIIITGLIMTFQLHAEENNLVEVKIKTSAICEMCKERIEKAVNKVDGVKLSDLNVETAVLTVSYVKDATTPEQIRQAVSKVGYDADDVPSNKKAYKKLPKCCQQPDESHKKTE